jgi:hypothetical protein
LDEYDCAVAALGGHLDVVTWLRDEKKVPWDQGISQEELEEMCSSLFDFFPNDFCDCDDCPYGPPDEP